MTTNKEGEAGKCVQCFRKIRGTEYYVRENDGVRHMRCWRKKELAKAMKPMVFSYPKLDWTVPHRSNE